MLKVQVSTHLKKLAKKSPAVQKQFFPSPEENESSNRALIDPLLEDSNKKVRGLVHKYPKRVLIELTMNCASYCRFCTRRREVSDFEKGSISLADIQRMVDYIKTVPSINEVIFSGGDPLAVPDLLIFALNKFMDFPQIKIIRVHTRVPVANPKMVTKEILNTFKKVNKKKPLYLSIHFEHPDEFTPQTLKIVSSIRKTGAILLSQTVFLKGINDSYEILEELFTRLAELGIRPYYIYRCDLVKGVEHFIVPIEKEIEIMTKLRKNISGIAFPNYVVDTPNGSGKIPVPLSFWQCDYKSFKDFDENMIQMY
ncbi:MAG: KamA family radical SAM protein [bacterium]